MFLRKLRGQIHDYTLELYFQYCLLTLKSIYFVHLNECMCKESFLSVQVTLPYYYVKLVTDILKCG